MIVSRDGSSAFSIHDSHIDVTIPFDREVMALMPRIGTNDGINNGIITGADSSDPELTENAKRTVLFSRQNIHKSYLRDKGKSQICCQIPTYLGKQ